MGRNASLRSDLQYRDACDGPCGLAPAPPRYSPPSRFCSERSQKPCSSRTTPRAPHAGRLDVSGTPGANTPAVLPAKTRGSALSFPVPRLPVPGLQRRQRAPDHLAVDDVEGPRGERGREVTDLAAVLTAQHLTRQPTDRRSRRQRRAPELQTAAGAQNGTS